MSKAPNGMEVIPSRLSRSLVNHLLRLDPNADEFLRQTLQQVSEALGQGHICLRLDSLSGEMDLATVQQRLLQSPLVSEPGGFAPFILDADRLYLARYWFYEKQLAEHFLSRISHAETTVDENRLKADLSHYFPESKIKPDWQKVAAAAAVLQPVSIISGGPGTGKTATVLRILAVLQSLADKPLRIALVAPTGKAAARMQEAIQNGKQNLMGDLILSAIPEQATTLHRLLGVRPGSNNFRHHAGYPLTYDLVVVDEASMIDLSLMTHLLDALPMSARLILLGDKDQLASVEAGSVFHDLCAVRGCDAEFAERIQRVTGAKLPPAESVTSPLGNAVMLLQHSYRFDKDSGIGRLAALINEGDQAGTLDFLEKAEFSDIRWVRNIGRAALDEVIAGYEDYIQTVQTTGTSSVAEAFAAFGRFQVLAAMREGPQGIRRINAVMEDHLQQQGIKPPLEDWYAGRPVMILHNDYATGLFNGDIGLTLPTETGLRVFFEAGEGRWRSLIPQRLPAHETVYAMTVHKSQGSEFENVLIVLPEKANELLNRPLFYTAVTRAKKAVVLMATEKAIKTAVEQIPRAESGLVERLQNSKSKI